MQRNASIVAVRNDEDGGSLTAFKLGKTLGEGGQAVVRRAKRMTVPGEAKDTTKYAIKIFQHAGKSAQCSSV